jgi:hypothetical protein
MLRKLSMTVFLRMREKDVGASVTLVRKLHRRCLHQRGARAYISR